MWVEINSDKIDKLHLLMRDKLMLHNQNLC